MLYYVIHISLYMVILNYTMDKKDELIAFRTTTGNLNYLKQLAESDERSVSYILNKMIQYFKESGKSVGSSKEDDEEDFSDIADKIWNKE